MTEKHSIHDFTYEEKQEALSDAFRLMKEREYEDRLKLIKSDWIEEKETYRFRQLAIEPKDIEWLIEQAEQVHLLEKQVASGRAHKLTYRKVAERYRDEKNRYREALEFYADSGNYQVDVIDQWGPEIKIMMDGGSKACQALEQSK